MAKIMKDIITGRRQRHRTGKDWGCLDHWGCCLGFTEGDLALLAVQPILLTFGKQPSSLQLYFYKIFFSDYVIYMLEKHKNL